MHIGGLYTAEAFEISSCPSIHHIVGACIPAESLCNAVCKRYVKVARLFGAALQEVHLFACKRHSKSSLAIIDCEIKCRRQPLVNDYEIECNAVASH